jgi:hypothetical protein
MEGIQVCGYRNEREPTVPIAGRFSNELLVFVEQLYRGPTLRNTGAVHDRAHQVT